MLSVRDILRIGRVQTYPASLLMVLACFLAPRCEYPLWMLASLFPLVWLMHFVGFGLNSFLDTAMGYDKRDPSKAHHPLVSGRVSLRTGCLILNWSAIAVLGLALLVSLYGRNPTASLSFLVLYIVNGYAYNCGLSKESIFGFIPICFCFTSQAAWGYFLSHETIDLFGTLLLGYVFFTILFQIAWSGHLKEIGIKERGNLLIRLGAKLVGKRFIPGNAFYFGWTIKTANVILGCILLILSKPGLFLLIWSSLVIVGIGFFLTNLISPRMYVRSRELFNMSMMEVLTIYFPLPMIMGTWSIPLMIGGLAYFIGINLLLWGVPYPKV
jgi:4-hydroxybenzoate polyprenyltransferase